MKVVWTGIVMALAWGGGEATAFACSCGRMLSFEEEIRTAPVVVVGTVRSTGEVPPAIPDEQSDRVNVRPPFMGTGITITVTSVVKGAIRTRNIRVWELIGGSCAGARWLQTAGSLIVIALRPVAAAPAEVRATWGAASAIPETDYFASGYCGQPLKILSPEDLNQWIGRKLR